MRLLIVEDERRLGTRLAQGLREDGFAVDLAHDLTTARDLAIAGEHDLVLLDLNLPRRNGREVLEDIKHDPGLMHIPVVVLTSSEAEEDILRSYRLHANCFITKPGDLEQLQRGVHGIEQFWFTLVKLPPEV